MLGGEGCGPGHRDLVTYGLLGAPGDLAVGVDRLTRRFGHPSGGLGPRRVGAGLPACAHRPPPCHRAHYEDREHDEHHQLPDEQPPEEPVPRQLVGGGVRPGARDVLRLPDQMAQGQGRTGDGDGRRPGAPGEPCGESGGGPHQQGQAEEEGQYAYQQTVGDASGALLIPFVPSHLMPPWTRMNRRDRRGAAPRRPRPAPRPPAPRRAARRRPDGPRRTRSWPGR